MNKTIKKGMILFFSNGCSNAKVICMRKKSFHLMFDDKSHGWCKLEHLKYMSIDWNRSINVLKSKEIRNEMSEFLNE